MSPPSSCSLSPYYVFPLPMLLPKGGVGGGGGGIGDGVVLCKQYCCLIVQVWSTWVHQRACSHTAQNHDLKADRKIIPIAFMIWIVVIEVSHALETWRGSLIWKSVVFTFTVFLMSGNWNYELDHLLNEALNQLSDALWTDPECTWLLVTYKIIPLSPMHKYLWWHWCGVIFLRILIFSHIICLLFFIYTGLIISHLHEFFISMTKSIFGKSGSTKGRLERILKPGYPWDMIIRYYLKR